MGTKLFMAAAAAAVFVVFAAEGDARFPFVISYCGETNASSVAHLLDAPAGKHGFVRVVGNEFVTDAGPIRFNGTNLTGPANFPEHDVADRLAARFARLGKEYVAVNTKNSKLFVGYADGREITLGDVSLTVGATETGAAVISLVSRNATGFGAEGAANILVAASGVAANTGAKIERVSKKLVRLSERGHAPVCAEGIPCEITLPAPPARVKCWALAGDGSRMKEIAPEAVGDGERSRIRLSPSCKTLWYEVAL